MRAKKILFAAVALILVVAAIITGGIVLIANIINEVDVAVITPDAPANDAPILSIADSGAQVGEGFGTLVDAPVESPFDFAEIRMNGLDYYMDADGIPRGRGAEELLDVRVSTGLYSGAGFGSGDWIFFDQPVWTVVVHNLPYSIPCGGGGTTTCNEPSGRFTVVIDAATGEVISSELFGGGPRSRDWQGIDLNPR